MPHACATVVDDGPPLPIAAGAGAAAVEAADAPPPAPRPETSATAAKLALPSAGGDAGFSTVDTWDTGTGARTTTQLIWRRTAGPGEEAGCSPEPAGGAGSGSGAPVWRAAVSEATGAAVAPGPGRGVVERRTTTGGGTESLKDRRSPVGPGRVEREYVAPPEGTE